MYSWILVMVTGIALSGGLDAHAAQAAQGEPSRDETGAIVEEGDLLLDALRVGDCFDDPRDPSGSVESVNAVPCGQPHDNETSDTFDLADGPFPGDAEIDSLASQGCLASFETYAGVSYSESELEVGYVTPTEEAWDSGERKVICFVYQPTGEKLTVPVGGRAAPLDDFSSTTETDTLSGTAAVVFGVVGLAFFVLLFTALWRIYTKAGEAGWKSLIPIWNLIVLLRIAGRPSWWVILLLVPLVNLVALVVMYVDVAKAFGKGTGFGLGMAFLGFLFLPILAFGDAEYRGHLSRSGGGA